MRVYNIAKVNKNSKMKRKNKKYIWIGLSVIILTVAIFFIYNAVSEDGFNLKALAIGDVPTGCNSYGQGTTNNEFACPSKECDVNGWDDCIEQTGEIPIVIFRTNAVNGAYVSGTWIALNCVPSLNACTRTSTLNGYCYSSTSGGTSNYRVLTLSDGTSIYVYNNYLYINGKRYTACNSADLTLTQKEPYKSNNQEVTGSTSNPFQCSKTWKILSATGTTKESGTASYSGLSLGKYQTGVKRINANEKFVFPGKINYAIIDTSSSCAIDLCTSDNTGIIKCILKDGCKVKSDNIQTCSAGTFCVQSDTGAECLAPFTTDFELKEGFTTSESIVFDYSIKSDRISSVSLLFKLVDPNNNNRVIDSAGPTTVTLPQDKHITFNNPGITGTYKILVEKTYNGITLTPEVREIRVGNPLSMTMSIPYSELTATQILAGAPFYVDIEVNENGVLTTDLTGVDIKATLKDTSGRVSILPIPTPTTQNDIYRYTFVAPTPGLFSVEATANKFGVLSNTEKREAEVRDPKIDISYTNMGFLINTKPGVLTVTFETKDAFGGYLDTSNKVKIIPSGASTGQGDIDVTSSVVKKETGKYEFSYNFVTGTYIIEVSSTAPGYVTETVLRSPSMNVDPGAIPKECISSDECPQGKICDSSGTCVNKEPPILLYVIIIVIVVIVIVLIVVIINLIRKKPTKKQDITIGGGL